MNTIIIWAPKFSTMEVLIKPFNIEPGLNKIIFTKTWQDKALYMDGEKIKSYPMVKHGLGGVYAVPIADFQQKLNGQLSLMDAHHE